MNPKNADANDSPSDNCLGIAARAAGAAPGITPTEVDPVHGLLKVDLDPGRASEQDLTRYLEVVRPELKRRFERCTMRLTGRACEGCALKYEHRAEAIPGIRHATASFIGGTMSVTYDQNTLPAEQVMDKVRGIGAPVKPLPAETPAAKGWFAGLLEGRGIEIASVVVGLAAMLIAWLGGRLGMPPALHHAFYVLAYVLLGWMGVVAGFQSLKGGMVDVDLLMILAALGAAYVGAPFEGAMLLFLFSFSNTLQDLAIDRTRKAIHSLMKLRPDNALVRRDGQLVTLPIGELVVGDHVIVRPGENIPLDGVISEGESALDESSLTGESMPVTKHQGDSVFAGTTNQSGGLEVVVSRLAKDSAIARLIRMVEDAQSEKAKTQRFLEKAEQSYALGVILLTAGLILVPWLVFNGNFDDVFYRAMTVMVVASPCALVISTPATILSAIGGAARRGVLFKGGAHLERAASIRVVAIDKTGTLTEGRPHVTDIVTVPGADVSEEDLLRRVAAVEAKSEHPLARAIVEDAKKKGLTPPPCAAFQSVSGKGAAGTVEGHRIHVGSEKYFAEMTVAGLDQARALAAPIQQQGRTVMFVAETRDEGEAGRMLGILAVADVLRPGAPEALKELRAVGIQKIVMLTGDHDLVAQAIGRQAGVDEVHAGLLPEDKVRLIRELKTIGPVLMIGDGVNDAPALAAADLGAAMGAAGTDAAMETADMVLMGENLSRLAFALDLSQKARRVVIQNLVFSLSVIIVLVISALGFKLPLPVGVIGHEGSTVIVCLNGLRLLRYRGRIG